MVPGQKHDIKIKKHWISGFDIISPALKTPWWIGLLAESMARGLYYTAVNILASFQFSSVRNKIIMLSDNPNDRQPPAGTAGKKMLTCR